MLRTDQNATDPVLAHPSFFSECAKVSQHAFGEKLGVGIGAYETAQSPDGGNTEKLTQVLKYLDELAVPELDLFDIDSRRGAACKSCAQGWPGPIPPSWWWPLLAKWKTRSLAKLKTEDRSEDGGGNICPAAPPKFARTTGSCISTSGCKAAHCNCGPSQTLAQGDCATAADCVSQGSLNCSADPRCHSFEVRSDCSTGGGTSKRWVSHPEGCESTVPNDQWVVYSRLGGGPPCPPPPPGPPPPPPPLLPRWKPTWDMARSTMLYTCNHSGWHDAKYAAKFGVVSYDWSNAKALWAQNQPMNCEEMLTEQAERVLKEDPGIVGEQPRVWLYRNTIKALNWFTSVREKLEDPSYAGWFVPFANYRGPQSNGSYHVPACTFEKCSGFCACRFPLLHLNRLSYLRFAADSFVADHDQLQTPELGGSLHNGGCKEECDCGKAPCGEYIFGPSHLPIVAWYPSQREALLLC